VRALRAAAIGRDARGFARGAACATRDIVELASTAARLRAAVARSGLATIPGTAAAPAPIRGRLGVIMSDGDGEGDFDGLGDALDDGGQGGLAAAFAPGHATALAAPAALAAPRSDSSRIPIQSLAADISYAAVFDRAAARRFPSATALCNTIRLHLLALEEAARAPADGMSRGTRFVYLFNERPPTLSAGRRPGGLSAGTEHSQDKHPDKHLDANNTESVSITQLFDDFN
jgi:hypothetical protein